MSAALLDRVIAELTAAMKAKDVVRLNVMRGLKSDLKYKEIEIGRPLADEDCLAVFQAAAKKRRDAIDAFKKGGRADRAGEEEAELAIIKGFLPSELSDEELTSLVDNVIAKLSSIGPADFGPVIKAVIADAAGRADGKRIAGVVNARLKKRP